MTRTSTTAEDCEYRATLGGKMGKPAEHPASSKEEVGRMLVVSGCAGDLQHAVDARFWMGRSSRSSVVYCSVWIGKPGPKPGPLPSGRGTAGGGGYHKESAALEEALTAAGVSLAYAHDSDPAQTWRGQHRAGDRASIGGVGEQAMQSALLAVARAAGWDGALEVI